MHNTQHAVDIKDTREVKEIRERVRRLLDLYRQALTLSPKLPRPVAYEFQHAMSHLCHGVRHVDMEGKWRQYRSAMEHLQRGLLDAWKLKVFESSFFRDLTTPRGNSPSPVEKARARQSTGEIITARLREYEETDADARPPAVMAEHSALARYRQMVKSKGPGQSSPAGAISSPLVKDFFECFHDWAQYELILSVFMRGKDLTTLEEMINAALDGFNDTVLKTHVRQLQFRIVIEIMRKDADHGLTEWLQGSPDRREHSAASLAAVRCPDSPAHAVFLKDLLAFYNVRLQPFGFPKAVSQRAAS